MRTGSRRWVVAVGAALVALGAQGVAAAPAHAAPAPGTAEVIGGDLFFTAGPGVDNRVEFFFTKGDLRWHVVDTAAAIVPGAGCSPVTASHVKCAGVLTIFADTKDGNDTLGVREAIPASQLAGLGLAAATRPVASERPRMTILGGPGDDRLTGGWGDDVLDGGPGADVMTDWAGADTVTYADRTVRVVADPDGAVSDDGEYGEGDTIGTSVENLIGGAGPDILTGSGGANLLFGGAGPDRLSGLDGADQLFGDAGLDLLSGGAATDMCYLGPDGAKVVDCEGVGP
jgi:Ca2+-binding RTX toxin-like protein